MHLHRLIAGFTVLCLLAVQLSLPAYAAVVDTREYLSIVDRQVLLDEVEAALNQQQVRDILIEQGVDPADAMVRVEAMSDAELALLAGNLESLPAGGGVLAVIGIVFVVLLILEVVGITNVFKGV